MHGNKKIAKAYNTTFLGPTLSCIYTGHPGWSAWLNQWNWI
jgi:hypothetical protein